MNRTLIYSTVIGVCVNITTNLILSITDTLQYLLKQVKLITGTIQDPGQSGRGSTVVVVVGT